MDAVTSTSTRPSAHRRLHIGLWIAQVVLAIAFTLAGVLKIMMPAAELAQDGGPLALPVALARFIGATEVFAAIGLILPAATRIRPMLTLLAAAGLVVVMVLAAGFHLFRGELYAIPINIALAGLAAFVAWGRFCGAPIRAR